MPTPPELELAWADDLDVAAVRAAAAGKRRQVMNMSRSTARLIRARCEGALVGWVGVDVDHDPVFPELFSLYVDPAARDLGLGRQLRLASALFLEARRITTVWGRLSLSHDIGVRAVWGNAATIVAAGDLPGSFVGACTACDLYGRECRERAFIAIDVATYRANAEAGLTRAIVDGLRLLVADGEPFRCALTT